MDLYCCRVAPFMGAWIETLSPPGWNVPGLPSLPSWERGLKLCCWSCFILYQMVAPFMGAWIETRVSHCVFVTTLVAPFMGAWIETYDIRPPTRKFMSLPSWERGLKPIPSKVLSDVESRSLHGSVD